MASSNAKDLISSYLASESVTSICTALFVLCSSILADVVSGHIWCQVSRNQNNFQGKHFGLLLCPAPKGILHHTMKPEVGTMLVKEDSWLFKVMLNWIMTNCYSAKEMMRLTEVQIIADYEVS